MSECIGCGLDEGYREHLRSRAENGAELFISISFDALLVLLRQVDALEKEANWLADRCLEFCDSNNYCYECALYPGNLAFPHSDCGQKIDIENARWRFEKHVVSDWREAARKAVEEEQCKK